MNWGQDGAAGGEQEEERSQGIHPTLPASGGISSHACVISVAPAPVPSWQASSLCPCPPVPAAARCWLWCFHIQFAPPNCMVWARPLPDSDPLPTHRATSASPSSRSTPRGSEPPASLQLHFLLLLWPKRRPGQSEPDLRPEGTPSQEPHPVPGSVIQRWTRTVPAPAGPSCSDLNVLEMVLPQPHVQLAEGWPSHGFSSGSGKG